MVYDRRPTYRFEFLGGLSARGGVLRISTAIDGSQVHRIRYELDDLQLAASLGQSMPAIVADFLDVCAAVYIADRLALRQVDGDSRSPGDRWHRRIHVVVPVRHPDRWRQPEVIAYLEELLAFLTDDRWSFEFIARSCAPRPAEAQLPLVQRVSHMTAVALHSGGLDSLFGLAKLLTSGHVEAIVPVTVVTNERVRHAAETTIDEISQSAADAAPKLVPAQVNIEISGSGRPRDDREPTQRARGMLFLATGISAAAMAGSNRLWVCENGVGAIGLPMTADQWGARSTRAMHPKTLNLLGRIASLLLDWPISIENTGCFVAKGELAREFARSPFIAAAQHTISCERATYIGHGESCGKCSSCILRRVALVAANVDDVVDGIHVQYRTDWFKPEAAWIRKNTAHLMAMRYQVERLREVTGGAGGFAALESVFPELFDIVVLAPTFSLAEDEVKHRLLRLYQAYVAEFDAFVAKIDRPGWGRSAIITELVRTPAKAAAG